MYLEMKKHNYGDEWKFLYNKFSLNLSDCSLHSGVHLEWRFFCFQDFTNFLKHSTSMLHNH